MFRLSRRTGRSVVRSIGISNLRISEIRVTASGAPHGVEDDGFRLTHSLTQAWQVASQTDGFRDFISSILPFRLGQSGATRLPAPASFYLGLAVKLVVEGWTTNHQVK